MTAELLEAYVVVEYWHVYRGGTPVSAPYIETGGDQLARSGLDRETSAKALLRRLFRLSAVMSVRSERQKSRAIQT